MGSSGAGPRPLPPERPHSKGGSEAPRADSSAGSASLAPPRPRESSVVVDPLSQIPDVPKPAGVASRRQAEATLVLRGRRADALRNKATAEHVRGKLLQKAKVVGFVAAAVVALGGGAYLARWSTEAPAAEPASTDAVQAAADPAVVEAEAAPGSEPPEEGTPLVAEAAPSALDEAKRLPAATPEAEAVPAGTQKRSGEKAGEAAEAPPGTQQDAGVLTLDQLPTAD